MDVGDCIPLRGRKICRFSHWCKRSRKDNPVGKLAGKLKSQGKRVVLAAADIPAAAGEQLKEWANRAEVEMIGGQEGADPALLYLMQQPRKQERQMSFCAILPDGFITRKPDGRASQNQPYSEKEYSDAYRETLVVLMLQPDRMHWLRQDSLQRWQTLPELF